MRLIATEGCCMKRYENYASALRVLETASDQDLDNEFIQGGIIDKFFLQFELGWKLLKWALSYEGDSVAASGSPRDIIKNAYGYFEFLDESLWLSMLRDRNNTAHAYDGRAASRLVETIIKAYVPAFQTLEQGMRARYGEMLLEPEA